MKIHRLIDDFEDEEIRNYWDKNFQHISTAPEIQEKIGISSICFSPAYRLILKTPDYYKNKEDYSISTSLKFVDQSNTEIYDAMNYKLCYDLSSIAEVRGYKDSVWMTRSKLFDADLVKLVINQIDADYKAHPFSPSLAYFKLKLPCKDLLLLGILVQNFTLMINNDDLIKLCKKQKEEFLTSISTLG